MATPAGVTVALNAKQIFIQRSLAFANALRLHASWAACALTDRKMRSSGEYARGERRHVLSLIGCTLISDEVVAILVAFLAKGLRF